MLPEKYGGFQRAKSKRQKPKHQAYITHGWKRKIPGWKRKIPKSLGPSRNIKERPGKYYICPPAFPL